MTDDKAIIEYLLEPENLEVAMEAAAHLERLKREIHPKFWELFNEKMAYVLSHSDLSKHWRYASHPHNNFRTRNARVYLRPKSFGKNTPYLQFSFGQEVPENNYSLFWGVCRELAFLENVALPDTSQLVAALEKRELYHENSFWVRWGYLPNKVYDAEFLRKMYYEADTFVLQIVMGVWEFFLEVEPSLNQTNLQLATGIS